MTSYQLTFHDARRLSDRGTRRIQSLQVMAGRVQATFDALKRQDSPRSVAARRNVTVSSLQARRRDTDAEAAATE